MFVLFSIYMNMGNSVPFLWKKKKTLNRNNKRLIHSFTLMFKIKIKKKHLMYVFSQPLPNELDNPVNWGCRIHWLHLCKGVRPPTPTNESPGYSSITGALVSADYPFTAITPGSTLAQNSNTWKCPIYDSNRTVWHLNWVETNQSY